LWTLFQGDCVVTVLLAEEDKVEDDAIFYLIFSGSTLYHCTSTRKVSSDTLETIAPGKYLNGVFSSLHQLFVILLFILRPSLVANS
jgi:hypothetical protein